MEKQELSAIIADAVNTEKLNEALNLLEDLRSEIGDFLNNSEFSELNPDEINQRLDYITRITMLNYFLCTGSFFTGRASRVLMGAAGLGELDG